ncbi:MAG: M28 family peptidase [Promethearchaeota archaeon]|nr:MAG: M28 family peptidase [Candidatus Lokiarchaeota archaeon]
MSIQIPTKEEIMGWIIKIYQKGIRRPGYDADYWVENWLEEKLKEFGINRIILEPLKIKRWKTKNPKLLIWKEESPEKILELPCFPIPYTVPAQNLTGEISKNLEQEKIVLGRLNLIKLPTSSLKHLTNKYYDPRNEFDSLNQLMPTGFFHNLMNDAISNGASAFIGYIANYPWDTCEYYAPYDAIEKRIPGVWISPKGGKKVSKLLLNHSVHAKISYEATNEKVKTNNVYGILEGNSDEWVIISTHHDAPWASATEDSSGIALVLAQAKYWSQVPKEKRPFNLLFLWNCAHMAGGKGGRSFVGKHKKLLEKTVVTIVLEHIARDCKTVEGKLIPTDDPVVKWWFITKNSELQDLTLNAIKKEGLYRSVVMPTEGFPPGSEHPPTDAAPFHLAGVPIISLLSAPPYLFDPADTLDKVHIESIEPITRAIIHIIEQLKGKTPSDTRKQV